MEATFRAAEESDTEAILGFMRLLYAQDGLSFDETGARRTRAGISCGMARSVGYG